MKTITSVASKVRLYELILHTALTNLFSGRPARGIMNRLMKELGSINCTAPPFPLASVAIAPLRSKAESLGVSDFSPLWCGQNASGCQEIPAASLTRALAPQAQVRSTEKR
jgi:nitronate monooxygenase